MLWAWLYPDPGHIRGQQTSILTTPTPLLQGAEDISRKRCNLSFQKVHSLDRERRQTMGTKSNQKKPSIVVWVRCSQWRKKYQLNQLFQMHSLAHKIQQSILFYFLINLFIYLSLAALGLRCCMRAFSSCGERGLLFVAVHGLLIVVASLVVANGL